MCKSTCSIGITRAPANWGKYSLCAPPTPPHHCESSPIRAAGCAGPDKWPPGKDYAASWDSLRAQAPGGRSLGPRFSHSQTATRQGSTPDVAPALIGPSSSSFPSSACAPVPAGAHTLRAEAPVRTDS
eukprot:1136526-Pelagomonas_calceolata.AAC.6